MNDRATVKHYLPLFLLVLCAIAPPSGLGQAGSVTSHTTAQTYPPPPPVVGVLHQRPPAPQPAISSDWKRFEETRKPDQLSSWADIADHEDAGVLTSGGPPYYGVFGFHAVYPNGTVKLKLPDNATRAQTLYSPTTRPPNGSCLEIGTAYTTEPNASSTTVEFYVYDFCKSPPVWTRSLVDQSFIDRYVGVAPGGFQGYAFAIYTDDNPPTLGPSWYALLYNNGSQQWETKYTSKGLVASDQRGWSIFETYYQPGQCSESLPVFRADSLKYFNARTQKWDDLAQQMPVGSSVPSLLFDAHHGGPCFQDDSHGKATYKLFTSGFNSWRVESQPPMK